MTSFPTHFLSCEVFHEKARTTHSENSCLGFSFSFKISLQPYLSLLGKNQEDRNKLKENKRRKKKKLKVCNLTPRRKPEGKTQEKEKDNVNQEKEREYKEKKVPKK